MIVLHMTSALKDTDDGCYHGEESKTPLMLMRTNTYEPRCK